MAKTRASRYILSFKVYRHPTVVGLQKLFSPPETFIYVPFSSSMRSISTIVGNNIIENISSSPICI